MGDKDGSVCTVCCLQFPRSRVHSDIKYRHTFDKFHTALTQAILAVNGSNNIPIKGHGGASSLFKKSLTCLPFVCPECISISVSALDRKQKVVSLEAEVRKLQVQVLKLLNKLHETINIFKDDVSNVADLIKKSSGNVKNLDDFFLGRDDDDLQDSGAALKAAIQFREKILTVFEDLCKFSKWIIVKPVSNINSSGPIDVATTTATGTNEDDDHHGSDDIENCGGDSSPVYKTETFQDDEDGSVEHKDEEIDSCTGYPSGSDDEFVPSGFKTTAKRKAEKHVYRTVRPSKDQDRDDDDTSDKSGDAEVDSNYGDDDDPSDEDFVPSGCKTIAKTKNFQQKSPSMLSSIDLTRMTPFKRALVTRIVTRAEKMTTPGVSNKRRHKNSQKANNAFQTVDPMKTHWMTYDPATDAITMDDVKITINDSEESLECSECDYKSRHINGNRAERLMYDHIFGHHLKLFACPHCPTNLTSASRFRQHVQGHQNPYDCDICGKSLKSPDILQGHKWSHLSQQEKAEAMECGLGPPRYIKNRMQKKLQKVEKKLQCSTCGKGFRIMCHLKLHEKTHREDKDLMCPQCGKTYKSSSGMTYHLKFSCFPGKGKDAGLQARAFRFPCDQCHRRFPYENKLKEHKRVYHSDNPAEYKCSLCDRTFKMNGMRINHEKTHSDAKPYQCRKGCGAAYKSGSNRQRHERTCKVDDR